MPAIEHFALSRSSAFRTLFCGNFKGMDTPADRLRFLREQKGFATAVAAAQAYGWNKYTYAQHENGTRDISRKAAERYGTAYRRAGGWILYGDSGSADAVPRIKFRGVIGAGQGVFPCDDTDEYVDAVIADAGAYAFKVKGDSMLPLAGSGDILFFGPPTLPAELIGRECIVELADGRRMFKRLRRGSRPDVFDLESYNASTIEDAPVTRAGRFLGLRRRG